MIFKVLPCQIPKFWEQIKYAAVKTEIVEEKYMKEYLLHLLYNLLSSKSQCFFHLNDEKILTQVCLGEIVEDRDTKVKSWLIRCVYSFQSVSNSDWAKFLLAGKNFAKKAGCKQVICYSNNPRIFELSQAIGFKEFQRQFVIDLEV